jgi:hypothetical protein
LWTAAEDALLRETYPDKPTRAVVQLLGLSDQQCYIRSRRLGLRKSEAFTRDNLRRLGNLLAQLPAAIACRIKPMDIERAKAICTVAEKLIDTARVEVKFLEVTGEAVQGAGFFKPQIPALPEGKANGKYVS